MRPKLRIAVVSACPFPFPRGTPVRALRLTEALARRGHEVHVATYHIGEGSVDPSIHVHRVRAPRRIAPRQPGPTPGKLAVLDPLLLGTLWRTLRQCGPFDVIHAHHYEGLLVALGATRFGRRPIPIVYDAHTMLASELPSYRMPAPRVIREAVGRVLDRTLPGRAEHVVAVSDLIVDRLVDSGAVTADRMSVVANGLEPMAFATAARRTGPPPNGGTIVYAGNLAPYHRVDLLLEAFRFVLAHRPKAVLRLLTDSPTDRVMDQARALGLASSIEVRSVPFAALPNELASADVAVNPRPVCDGIPQKNLNYMAAGLPLVAFEGSLHPCRDGETGIAVRKVCAEDLAESILELLVMPERATRIGDSARALAHDSFSWDERAERVEEIYHSVLAPGRDRTRPDTRTGSPVAAGSARPDGSGAPDRIARPPTSG